MTTPVSSPQLFSSFALRDLSLKNRIMVSPMCQYRSVDGGPVDWHLVHLGQFAIGGAALVFHEETAVSPEGRKTWACAGLYNEDHVAGYHRINQFIKAQGAASAIQLGHSGRKGSNAGAMHGWRPLNDDDAKSGMAPWECLSASAIANDDGWPLPRAMTVADIESSIDDWVQSTRLADAAEFDVLEIHGAHGYLIHQFLSPVSNHRNDNYGGSRANRMRYALEVTEAVRGAWPASKPLFFRVSAVDGGGGIWDLDDTVALSRELKALGVDVIDCSSGGMGGSTGMSMVPRVPGYHVPYSQAIRREVDIPTVTVGLVTEPLQAENILINHQADIVAMARELMAEPGWPLKAARMLGVEDPWSVQPVDYAFRLRRRSDIARLTLDEVEDASVYPSLARLIDNTPEDR